MEPRDGKPANIRTTSYSRETTGDIASKSIRNVLLVDDNKINLQLLIMYMKKSGHTFTTASDGLQAFEAYKSMCKDAASPSSTEGNAESSCQDIEASEHKQQVASPFEFVLMDISMPIMDGLESTRHIRAYERANGIKYTTVIALTGLASASAQQEAYSSDVDTFMTKPVELKELSKLLE